MYVCMYVLYFQIKKEISENIQKLFVLKHFSEEKSYLADPVVFLLNNRYEINGTEGDLLLIMPV